jgi:hypothetical protein
MYGRLHSPIFYTHQTHYKAQTTLAFTTPNIFSQWVNGIADPAFTTIRSCYPSNLFMAVYKKGTFSSAHFQLSTKSRLYFQVIDCHPYENLKKVEVKYFFQHFQITFTSNEVLYEPNDEHLLLSKQANRT